MSATEAIFTARHCEVMIWYTFSVIIQGLLQLSSVKLGSGTQFSVIIQGLLELSSVKLGSGRRFSVIIQGLLELSSVKL